MAANNAGPTPIETARKSRATRAADKTAEQAQPQAPEPSETPKPKPAAKLDLGAKEITYWFPSIELTDGTRVECPHSKYGHESEPAAGKCGRSLAAQHGVTLA